VTNDPKYKSITEEELRRSVARSDSALTSAYIAEFEPRSSQRIRRVREGDLGMTLWVHPSLNETWRGDTLRWAKLAGFLYQVSSQSRRVLKQVRKWYSNHGRQVEQSPNLR
jgi:hypothetical protein